MQPRKIAYALTTGLFSLMMLGSAGMYLTRQPQIVEGFTHLGYPLYFITILGTAKLLGALALAIPVVPRGIKEWAYAGFVFNLIAAIASHLGAGDGISGSMAPAVPFVLLIASYLTWRAGASHPTTTLAAQAA